MNFHPVTNGVKVSCERTLWGSQLVKGEEAMSLQLAAALYIYIHYGLKKRAQYYMYHQFKIQ